jgi:hypothetical protein
MQENNRKKLVLGIDFDNTIISYDKVFYSIALKKKLVKKKIQKKKTIIKKEIIKYSNEDEWTRIQGLAYGKYISKAKQYPNALTILKNLSLKYKLYLISHKTKKPFIGKNYNLRKKAMMWLRKNNFINSIESPFNSKDIYFENTVKKKIQRIKKLKCNIYIDDLKAILSMLPNKIKKIHFQEIPKKNWLSIRKKLLS